MFPLIPPMGVIYFFLMGGSLLLILKKFSKIKNMTPLSSSLCIFMLFLYYFWGIVSQKNEGQDLLLNFPTSLWALNMMLLGPCLWANHQKMFSTNFMSSSTFFLLQSLSVFLLFSLKSSWSIFIMMEFCSLPIFFLLMSKGSTYRSEASYFMVVFTMSSAIFLFLFLSSWVSVSSGESSIIYTLVSNSSFSGEGPFIFQIMALLVFFSKFPLFLIHVWLPKAHVEAPVAGSMVLAGILLKLGGFGFFSFSSLMTFSLLPKSGLLSFVLLSSNFVGLICVRQKDLKILIALSSVQHMALSIVGLVTLASFSMLGSLFLMVGHGLMSALIFFLGSTNYVGNSQRSFFFSSLSLWQKKFFFLSWIMAILINSGFPPFLNFLGEIMILSTMILNMGMSFLLMGNFFFSGVYSVILLSSFIQKEKIFFFQPFMMKSGEFLGSKITVVLMLPLLLLWKFNFFF